MDMSIVFGFFLAWFITNNDYTRFALEWLYAKSNHPITDAAMEHLSCMKCLTFWITLLHTQSLLFALIASFIAYIYAAYIERD
jgi:hypothetical protein